MTFEEYKKVKALNNSGIKLLLRSPLHYWHEYLNPNKVVEPPSRALVIGTLLHDFVFLGEQNFCLEPNINKRTKQGKLDWAQWQEDNPNLTPLKEEELENIMGMFHSLTAGGGYVLKPDDITTDCEVDVFWKINTDNRIEPVDCKARLDTCTYYEIEDGSERVTITDLKTTNDASFEGMHKAINNYDYYRQAAWYILGVGEKYEIECEDFEDLCTKVTFRFVFVEKKPPYAMNCTEIGFRSLEQGLRECINAANIYAQCTLRDRWPAYNIENGFYTDLATWKMDSIHKQHVFNRD